MFIPRYRPRIRSLAPGRVFVIVGIAVVMVVGSPVIGQDRPDLFGIGSANAGWLLLHPDGYERESFRRIAQAGGVASRVAASWADIEATQGQYDWSLLDEQLGYCEEFGIELYALVVNTPAWASPTGQVAPDRRPLAQYEPNFQAFCTALASRYAGRITYYEFWNEENGYGWHRDDGFNNVEEYVPFLRMAYEALKAGDPNCVVSIGGLDDPELSGGDTMWRGAYYMSLFYDEVQTLGWENVALFDAVSDHPYGSTTQLQIKLDALHDVLVAHGDGDKPIWLTEWGYNTQGMSQAQQAASVEAYMAVLLDPQFDYVTMAGFVIRTCGRNRPTMRFRGSPAVTRRSCSIWRAGRSIRCRSKSPGTRTSRPRVRSNTA
jgi:hypothetical protein